MQLIISKEFISICNKIMDKNKTQEEWSAIESDDMFQSESFEGGYDATEEAFCFSYYDQDRSEFWFQINIHEVKLISKGEIKIIKAYPCN